MSNLADILSKLKIAKPNLVIKYKIHKIGIFGSYARNEQTPKSDVDILVEFSEPIGMDFVKLAVDLEKVLNENVDLVSRNGIKPRYLKYVEKDLMYA